MRARPIAFVCLVSMAACYANTATINQANQDGSSLSGAEPEATIPADAAGGLRRLTSVQYANSVADVLGSDIVVSQPLDADVPLNALESLGAGSATTTPQGAILYDSAARALASQRFADAAQARAFVGCTPATPPSATDGCVQEFLQRVGRSAWRRPLTAAEQTAYSAVYAAVAEDTANPMEGMQALTAALLASPYFVYRVEVGTVAADGSRRLTDAELATRLSYFLWNSTPDAALLAAVDAGALSTPEGLLGEAKRLLADPRATTALTTFFEQWLGFSSLGVLSKDAKIYPKFTATMGKSMRQEFDAIVAEIVADPSIDVTEILTRKSTYVNAELASLYGIAPPAGDGNKYSKAELPTSGPRAGLLTLGGFLAAHAKPDATAPIGRGLFVRTRLLCQQVHAPPANVDQLPPALQDGKPVTMRQRLAKHQSDPSCNSCHKAMDPLGLPLEHFDGIGAYRDTDQGLALDVSGSLDGTPFDGAQAMGELLRQSPQVQTCIVRQLFRQAIGSMDTPSLYPALSAQADAAVAMGFGLKPLLLNFIASDLFRIPGATL